MKKLIRKQLKKIYFSIMQTKKKMSNNVNLTYLYRKKSDSEQLIVIFSSMVPVGQSIYHYVRTLEDSSCNRLYILDDFGYKKRGVFYLGENGGMEVREAVEELIRQMIDEHGIKKTIFAGTSKGGFAALYFGIRMQIEQIIVGAPIYKVNKFLKNRVENSRLAMINEDENDAEEKLDCLLSQEIEKNEFKGAVSIQYSRKDECYKSQSKPLISALNDQKIELRLKEEEYEKHEFCPVFFPEFLRGELKEVVNRDD
ncbi:hypothetical protein HB943_11075 [Listeria weihenstephanensis]|uniref:Two component regulator three Y domain-containing protein n=1 Tax=Listeria weihenstephanensis TaxID=1006155 RepID=A0A841Z7F8_9LIST|nr:accessory Sec system protein Asp2 [Listeria weihenstephanensis]MBC1501144.1 hypothetical protein [Listeria weihenstephanensis]